MSYQTWLLDVLSDEFRGSKGFRVDYIPGWETRGASNPSHFAPLGVINHHTGSGSYNNLLQYMAFNSRIAPLCNTATSRPQDGVVRITVVSAGRANHAGRGHLSWTGTDNGNYRALGRENQNNGGQSWPSQQIEAIRRADAAELKHLGATTDRLADHKTYAPMRKVDRYSINLDTERREVEKLMRATDPWEEFWMSLTDDEKQVLKDFAGYLAGEDGTAGDSFARQFLAFNREERGRLIEFLEAIKYMDSSPRGQGRAMSALWREAGARGWLLDWERFKENRKYTEEDLK